MTNESTQQTDFTVEQRTPSRIWRAWTFSCGLGEFLGMAVAAGAAALFLLLFGKPDTLPSRIASLLVMVLAGVLEGTSICFFQWRVLHRIVPALSARAWLTPTIIVAAAGWFVGMLPQTFFGSGEGGEVMPEPSPPMVVLFAIMFGGLAGLVFGVAQWMVLRRHVEHANVWIWTNAIGWSLAMGVIYCGASLPNGEWSMTAVIATGAVTGIVAGLAIGVVTGGGLLYVLRDRL